MSARPPEVLERNLEALLRRAWVPVHPSPAFVARLERALAPWLAGAAPRRRAWPRLAAAAAALLVVAGLAGLGTYRALAPRPERTDAPELLAAGEVALRERPDGAWRAATPGERRDGLRWSGAGGLELATPAAAGFELREAEALALALEPRTELWLEGAAGARQLGLARGALELELAATPLRLVTPEGRALAESASLAVAATAGEVRVELRAGFVWLDAGAGPVALAAPARAVLADGEVRVLEPAAGAGRAERAPVAPQVPPDLEAAPEEEREGEPAPAPAPATLRGRVRDARDGAPVARFELTLLRAVPLPSVAWPESRVFDGVDGRFEWADVEPGEYTVFVQAEGRAAWRARGLQLGAGAPVALEVELVEGATVRGLVRDRETGQPIAGALVVSETDAPVQVMPVDAELMPAEVRARATTGADGRFELAQLSPGTHVLRAGGAELAFARSEELSLRAGERAGGVVLELSAGGAIEGRIEREGGLPRVGVQVIASEQVGFGSRPSSFGMALTDDEGRYRIAPLPPGAYVLLVLPEEQETEDMRPDIRSVVVVEGETARADFLRATENATLRGRLLDALGAPAPGATVNVSPVGGRGDTGWRAATAQADGGYALGDLAPGEYEVYLGSGSGVVRRERVRLAPGEVLEREYRLEGQSLVGSVTDARTGAAVSGYVLLLAPREGPDAGRRLPSGGAWIGKSWPASAVRFELPHVPPGLYDLVALTEDGAYALEVLEAIEVGRDVPAEVAVELRPGGAALVRVVDAEGAPVARALVEFTDPFGRSIDLLDARTDSEGVARLEGLAPGAWQVRAAAEGRGAAEAVLSIDAGARRELRLALEP